jgi:transposase
MRQIRELLHLHFEQDLSQRLIARSLGVVRSTVERVIGRFAAAGLTWPPDPALSNAELERRLYRGPAHQGEAKRCARPNYTEALKQLARKGVTRRLLWSEYRDANADGIGYSVFCDELAAYTADRDLAYRNDHVPGEKAYFNFAGLTLRYQDGDAVRSAQLFVAALGYSNAIFAHAYADQTAVSWLDGQHRAFVAFGGVPRVGVPDNPRALVARTDRYEPTLTAVYADFARHYAITIIPARVRKPKDKAAIEGAVKILKMRLLVSARDRVFASLAALNAWLGEGLIALNTAPFQKRVGSRHSQLIEAQVHLSALPATRLEAPTYLIRKVAHDYHVDVQRHYYSVPWPHVGQRVEVRVTGAHFEVLRHDQRIALHRRVAPSQRFVTDPAHMPAHHQAFRDPKIRQCAAGIGTATTALIEVEAGLRASVGTERHRLRPHTPLADPRTGAGAAALAPVNHEHVRGGDYYSGNAATEVAYVA